MYTRYDSPCLLCPDISITAFLCAIAGLHDIFRLLQPQNKIALVVRCWLHDPHEKNTTTPDCCAAPQLLSFYEHFCYT